jgi:hypothetical protein
MSNTAKSQTMAEKSQSDKKSNPPNIKKAHQQAKYALRDRKVRRSPSPCRKIRTRRLVTEQLKSESNLKLVDKSTDKKRQRDDGDQLGDQKKQKVYILLFYLTFGKRLSKNWLMISPNL